MKALILLGVIVPVWLIAGHYADIWVARWRRECAERRAKDD
jgi:hypothetical protein